MKEQRKKQKKGLITFLEDCAPIEVGENVGLERLFEAFNEDPEIFQKNWLQPLLAEGLNLDSVYELVMESILCPN
ncbi:MAG TPA: hypothetical protein VEI26_15910 [Terriglobales bacterium]|nr:hypothetical protein [Terriglobales bacterium]